MVIELKQTLSFSKNRVKGEILIHEDWMTPAKSVFVGLFGIKSRLSFGIVHRGLPMPPLSIQLST